MAPPDNSASLAEALVSRRKFLMQGGAAFGAVAAASSGLLAACSKAAAPSNNGKKNLKVRIAYSASAFPSIVNNRYGPLHYGPKFGLNIAASDLQTFSDQGTATAAVFAGQADVFSGALLTDFLLIQQKLPFKVLVSVSNGNDILMVGAGKFDSIDKVTSPDAVVGIDTPGGLVNLIANAMLLAHGIKVNIESLPHTKVFGDSDPRTAAFINGQTTISLVHSTQMPAIQKALGASNVHILSTLWLDVHGLVFECMAAPVKWISENPDAATALVSAVLTGNRELAKDYNLYKQSIDEFIPGSGLTDADLRPVWQLARQYEFWPYNGDLEDNSIAFTEQVGNQSGVLTGTLSPSQVVDRGPLQKALSKVGSVTVQQVTG
jgi:ABC-type nitrate/sulfonate/bicarbonate transport system substrate-binding protein